MPYDSQNPVRRHLDGLRQVDGKALCQFVIAGDPTPEIADDLARASVDCGVDVIEYCIPFARSITDGPVIQQGYARALEAGMTTTSALDAMARLAKRVPVVLLADYRATVAPMGLGPFLAAASDHGAGAVLLHGLPPLMRDQCFETASDHGLGVVATAYAQSEDNVIAAAARQGTAFSYLVSSYGRSGGQVQPARLTPVIDRLRAHGAGRVGVGFGIRSADDHRAVYAAGADMSIMGSAMTAIIAENLNDPAALRASWCAELNEIARAKTDWQHHTVIAEKENQDA